MTDSFAAKLLERACELELITLEDIHFSSDSIIWNQLKKSNDTAIKYYISLIENVRESYKTCSPSHQKSFKIDGAKFSGTDPFVYMSKNNIVPLSSVDIRYKDEYEQIKYFCQSGWHIII